MTVTLGNTTLPGVQTTIESSSSVVVSAGSPGDVGIVGEADLGSGTTQGNANPDTVYKITTPVGARNKFGEGSLLTESIIDALNMGAYPVFAVASSTTAVTGEDLSGMSSTSGTLNNGPATVDPSETTFTIDGSTKSTVITYDDPHQSSPASGEVYLNPVTREFELDAAPGDTSSTNDTVDYTYYGYTNAITTLRKSEGNRVDFFTVLSENSTVVNDLHNAVSTMENNYNFALGIAGAGTYINDTSAYTNPFSDSRMQLLYPTRTDDGNSILGSVVGLRAALGANGSIMRRQLPEESDLRVTLSQTQKENLDGENVVPVANEASGARIVTDATSISTGNMQDGLSRIIVDYVTDIVHTVTDSFIGQLHTQGKRNAMKSIIVNQLRSLVEQDSIEQFTVVVEEKDAYTANVEISVETVKPLRNVVANIAAGEIADN